MTIRQISVLHTIDKWSNARRFTDDYLVIGDGDIAPVLAMAETKAIADTQGRILRTTVETITEGCSAGGIIVILGDK